MSEDIEAGRDGLDPVQEAMSPRELSPEQRRGEYSGLMADAIAESSVPVAGLLGSSSVCALGVAVGASGAWLVGG